MDYTDETGKRRQRSIGKSPAAALDAWRICVGIKSGSIPPEPDPIRSRRNRKARLSTRPLQTTRWSCRPPGVQEPSNSTRMPCIGFGLRAQRSTLPISIARTSWPGSPPGEIRWSTASRSTRGPSIAGPSSWCTRYLLQLTVTALTERDWLWGRSNEGRCSEPFDRIRALR